MIIIHTRLILQKTCQHNGKISKGSIIDYYTIVGSDQDSKLNINRFIRKKTINKANVSEGVVISVIDKTVFYDYEVYKKHKKEKK